MGTRDLGQGQVGAWDVGSGWGWAYPKYEELTDTGCEGSGQLMSVLVG